MKRVINLLLVSTLPHVRPFNRCFPVAVSKVAAMPVHSSRSLDRSNVLSNPAADIFRLMDELDPFPKLGTRSVLAGLSHNMPLDIKETKDSYELHADLPGIDIKDIHISLKGNSLIISAERQTSKKEEGDRFRYVERASGHISRTLTLPDDADLEHIDATTHNGVLTVTVKKNAEAQPRKIEIKDSNGK